MIRTSLVDPTDRVAVEVESFWDGPHTIEGDERALLITDPFHSHGTFKTLEYSGAGTTTIVLPNDDGSLILTDILLFGDKVNAGTVELRFTDGTNNAPIVKPTVTDAPVNFGHQVGGRFQGWRDARIDLIVTNNVNGSVTVGYVKVSKGLPYSEWDALR